MSLPILEIKTLIDPHEYINKHYNRLIPKGPFNSKYICPSHKEGRENTPSLSFTKNKKGHWAYKCFACNDSGSLIDLIMKIEGIDFKEATIMVCENENMQYSLTPPNPDHEEYKDIMTGHARRYMENLKNSVVAMDYLNSRGITEASIKSFGLGLTDEKEYTFRGDIGGIADRISFPILECKVSKNKSKVLGMGYRTLKDIKDPSNYDKKKDPKYINDASQVGKEKQESRYKDVFIKGNCLYGYKQAYDSIRELGYAIVVEGYMDVIGLHQSGIKNTVGAMGTALTEGQRELLRKLTNKIVFFFDNDDAGKDNMNRVLPDLLKDGFIVEIVVNKIGKDPADLSHEMLYNSNLVLSYILNNSVDAVRYTIDSITSKFKDILISERTIAYSSGMNIVNVISDKNYQQVVYQFLKEELRMN